MQEIKLKPAIALFVIVIPIYLVIFFFKFEIVSFFTEYLNIPLTTSNLAFVMMVFGIYAVRQAVAVSKKDSKN